MLAKVQFVYLGGDTTYWHAVPEGQPGAPTGVLKKVVFCRKTLALLEIERSNPDGIVSVQAVWESQKLAPLGPLSHHFQRYG
jgi:hypothetical protein